MAELCDLYTAVKKVKNSGHILVVFYNTIDYLKLLWENMGEQLELGLPEELKSEMVKLTKVMRKWNRFSLLFHKNQIIRLDNAFQPLIQKFELQQITSVKDMVVCFKTSQNYLQRAKLTSNKLKLSLERILSEAEVKGLQIKKDFMLELIDDDGYEEEHAAAAAAAIGLIEDLYLLFEVLKHTRMEEKVSHKLNHTKSMLEPFMEVVTCLKLKEDHILEISNVRTKLKTCLYLIQSCNKNRLTSHLLDLDCFMASLFFILQQKMHATLRETVSKIRNFEQIIEKNETKLEMVAAEIEAFVKRLESQASVGNAAVEISPVPTVGRGGGPSPGGPSRPQMRVTLNETVSKIRNFEQIIEKNVRKLEMVAAKMEAFVERLESQASVGNAAVEISPEPSGGRGEGPSPGGPSRLQILDLHQATPVPQPAYGAIGR